MIHLLTSTAQLHPEAALRSAVAVRSTADAQSGIGMRSTGGGRSMLGQCSEAEGMAAGSRDSGVQTSIGAGGKVQAAINYMAAHLNRPLRISTLTALTGLSASHFFVLFKAATGATPLKYFLRLRMRLACKLLGDRSLSVKEIAFFLDYADPFHFSRTFKQFYGFAPSHYRNRILDATRCSSANQTTIVKTKTK